MREIQYLEILRNVVKYISVRNIRIELIRNELKNASIDYLLKSTTKYDIHYLLVINMLRMDRLLLCG